MNVDATISTDGNECTSGRIEEFEAIDSIDEAQLVREVARRTGESLSTIRQRGFHLSEARDDDASQPNAAEDTTVLLLQLEDAFERRDFATARRASEELCRRGMRNKCVLFRLAYCLQIEDEFAAAAALYAECGACADDDGITYFNLGLCYQSLGQWANARDAFRSAVHENRDTAEYWRELADCLEPLKDQAAELEARENVWLLDKADYRDLAKLAALRLRHGDSHAAVDAYATLTEANRGNTRYAYGLAAAYKASYLYRDAYHVASLITDSEDADLARVLASEMKTVLTSIAPTLPLIRTGGGVVGPDDYINPYTLLRFEAPRPFSTPVNLFVKPADWPLRLNDLHRKRSLLRAESALNDGRIPWVQSLTVTEEVIHRSLAGLDEQGWNPLHWVIFCQPSLNRFLMFGDPAYFVAVSEDLNPPNVLQLQLGADDLFQAFHRYVSGFFKHRWRDCMKNVLASRRYRVASVLLCCSLPLTTADFDEAIEPMRLHFTQRRNEVTGCISHLTDLKTFDRDAKRQASAEARVLNALPPPVGLPMREGLCDAYLSLGVELLKSDAPTEAVSSALAAAEGFRVSLEKRGEVGRVRHALIQRDSKRKMQFVFDEALRNAAELHELHETKTVLARDHSLRLRLRHLQTDYECTVLPDRIVYGGTTIAAEDIAAVRQALGRHWNAPAPKIFIKSSAGVVINVHGLTPAFYDEMVTSMRIFYFPKLIKRICYTAIKRGLRIGSLLISAGGVRVDSDPGAPCLPWSRIQTTADDLQVHVCNDGETQAFATLSALQTWNACLFPHIVPFMQKV